jgi:hypothetical protein
MILPNSVVAVLSTPCTLECYLDDLVAGTLAPLRRGWEAMVPFSEANLVDRKAQFDIVNVVPYAEMRKIGLTRALVNAKVKR